MMYPNSKVAAGLNNTGGLVAWESIIVNHAPFFAPVIFGFFDTGQDSTLLDGSLYSNGYPMSGIQWVATQWQVYYLSQTFCAGGRSGPITIQYRQTNPDTYVIANATLVIDKLSDSAKKSMGYEPYKGKLTRLVVIG